MTKPLAEIMPDGTLSLPAEIWRQCDLQPGTVLTVDADDQGIMLRTDVQHARYVQALARKLLGGREVGSVDDFLAAKRAAAAREEAEFE